jgi:hypothetical protein
MASTLHAQLSTSRRRLFLRRLFLRELFLRRRAVKRQGSRYDGFFADPDAVESDYRRFAPRSSDGDYR